MPHTRRLPLRDMLHIALCAALLAVCAWVTVPLGVPVTLQTFGVFVTAGVLGARRGAVAVAVYMLLGVLGAPVFSGFRGGPGVLFDATGGYLLGFLIATPLMGALLERAQSAWRMALAMAAGLLVCYAAGTVWLILLYTLRDEGMGLMRALSLCVLPFLLPDAVKIALAVWVVRRLRKAPGLRPGA